jgi:tRNA 2-thiouridine synthesizing protein E
MFDINKAIANEEALLHDPKMYLTELEDWSESIAQELARQENIQLTDAHLEVIHVLREHYRLHGLAPHARQLLDGLEERFHQEGGRKHLYQLFPGGPITQGSKIAGLPLPPYSTDHSFGSVM